MPNWVSNTLSFKSEEDAKKVWDGMQWHNKRFSFKGLIPHPATREECEEKYILKPGEFDNLWRPEKKLWFDWYHWQIHNWGCKWDCDETQLIGCEIQFQTPWNPPCDDFLQKLANKFNVSFTSIAYDECEDPEDEDFDESEKIFPDREFKPE